MKKFFSHAAIYLLTAIIGAAIAVTFLYTTYIQPKNSTQTSTKKVTGITETVKLSNLKDSKATDAYETVSKAVVTVQNYQNPDDEIPDWFKQWRKDNNQDSSSNGSSESSSNYQLVGEGSGVAFKKDGENAYIITNNHVIEGAKKVTVTLSTGEVINATVVGTNVTKDIAVLKVSAQKITKIAKFADSSAVKVGQTVLAVGSPLGSAYASSVTQGIISAKERTITEDKISVKAIQTDTAINPGNSGGPLINLNGEVIGINSMKISDSEDNSGTAVEGMGFAIQGNVALSTANEILDNK
jgi:serine protease Do